MTYDRQERQRRSTLHHAMSAHGALPEQRPPRLPGNNWYHHGCLSTTIQRQKADSLLWYISILNWSCFIAMHGGWFGQASGICTSIPEPCQKEICSTGEGRSGSCFGGKDIFITICWVKILDLLWPLLLQYLCSESCLVPKMVLARIQRWALTLSANDYTICYKPGKEQTSTESLSRLPLPDSPKEAPIP